MKILVSSFVLALGVVAQAAVVNGGFEINNVGLGNYLYPTGAGTGHDGVVAAPWTFSGAAGITANRTAWGGVANSGDYFAFLQSGAGSSTVSTISQTLTGLSAGRYTASFYARQRGGYGQNIITTLGNSQVVFSGTPASSDAWTRYTGTFYYNGAAPDPTLSFSVTGGTSSDSGSFIDDVSVAAVPGPAAAVPFLAGVLRRRRRASAR